MLLGGRRSTCSPRWHVNFKAFQPDTGNPPRVPEEAEKIAIQREPPHLNHRRKILAAIEPQHQVLSHRVDCGKKRNLKVPQFDAAPVALAQRIDHVLARQRLKPERYDRRDCCKSQATADDD